MWECWFLDYLLDVDCYGRERSVNKNANLVSWNLYACCVINIKSVQFDDIAICDVCVEFANVRESITLSVWFHKIFINTTNVIFSTFNPEKHIYCNQTSLNYGHLPVLLFISSVLIYRKCTQRNIFLLHGKSDFWKKIWARAAAPPLESATGLHNVITRMYRLVQLHVCSVYDIQVAPKSKPLWIKSYQYPPLWLYLSSISITKCAQEYIRSVLNILCVT